MRWSTCSTILRCRQEHKQAIVWQRQTERVLVKSEGKRQESRKQVKIQKKIQRNQKCEPSCQRLTQGQKTSKAGLSGLENSKSEASSDIQESEQTCATDTSWNSGGNGEEWNDGFCTTDTSWIHDEWSPDGLYGRKIDHFSLHRRQHIPFLFERRSEVHRNPYHGRNNYYISILFKKTVQKCNCNQFLINSVY